MLRTVLALPPTAFDFLVAAAEDNATAARAAQDGHAPLAAALQRGNAAAPSPRATAQSLAGAASEARMTGLLVPLPAIAGSGNHGIANFLGVLGVAHALGANRDALAHALAIASTVTVCIKAHTGRLTAFCGCAIAPATGVAAATVFLKGGDIDAMEHAMKSVIGTFAGMICDGAKVSCAFKVATVVGAAVDLGILAMEGAYIPDGDGILGDGIDRSFANLAALNDQGLRKTETTVLRLIGA